MANRQTAIRIKSSVKAGPYGVGGANHNQSGLRIKSRVKAGLGGTNHNQGALRVR